MLRIKEWASQVNECKQSGQSVKQWCNEHGVSIKTFYNHMKVIREEMLEYVNDDISLPSGSTGMIKSSATIHKNINNLNEGKLIGQQVETEFAALPMPQSKSAAVTVRIGGCSIDIQNGADISMVDLVIHTVARL